MDHHQVYSMNGSGLNHFPSSFSQNYGVAAGYPRGGGVDSHVYDTRPGSYHTLGYDYPSPYTQILNISSYHSNYILPDSKSSVNYCDNKARLSDNVAQCYDGSVTKSSQISPLWRDRGYPNDVDNYRCAPDETGHADDKETSENDTGIEHDNSVTGMA